MAISGRERGAGEAVSDVTGIPDSGISYGKRLDADYIKNLLSGKRESKPKPPRPDDTPVHVSSIKKPDPLKLPRAGDPQPGDKGDIWAQWVKQGRTGAAELIERWG